MTSKPVALLLADLGVTKTHSRPHVSNGNPFSEAQFKAMKYRSAHVSRLLKRLHLRGLLAKIPRSRRWRVTQLGHAVMSTAVLPARGPLPERLSQGRRLTPPRSHARYREVGQGDSICSSVTVTAADPAIGVR